jgi:hypothetical protein
MPRNGNFFLPRLRLGLGRRSAVSGVPAVRRVSTLAGGAGAGGGGGAGAVRSQVPVDVDTGVSDTGVGGATG